MFGWWQWVSNEEHWLAQLGERRYAERPAEREVTNSNPGRTNTQVLLCNDICKRLDFLVSSDKHENEKP